MIEMRNNRANVGEFLSKNGTNGDHGGGVCSVRSGGRHRSDRRPSHGKTGRGNSPACRVVWFVWCVARRVGRWTARSRTRCARRPGACSASPRRSAPSRFAPPPWSRAASDDSHQRTNARLCLRVARRASLAKPNRAAACACASRALRVAPPSRNRTARRRVPVRRARRRRRRRRRHTRVCGVCASHARVWCLCVARARRRRRGRGRDATRACVYDM